MATLGLKEMGKFLQPKVAIQACSHSKVHRENAKKSLVL
jgi:hypothetical protein